MTSFFVPCGNVHGKRMPFWCPLFLCPAVQILLYCWPARPWFYYIFVVPVVCDDFTIRVSGEQSRASDELNDFLILTNERPTRFYYLFRGWTSRTIFLYWPTKAILIFFEGARGIPSVRRDWLLEQSAGVAESCENQSSYEGVFEDYAQNLCRILIHDS